MAAPLSQNEIDALLTSEALDNDVQDAEQAVQDIQETSESSSQNKHFGLPEYKPFRYHFKYNSPVLKSQDIVIDPDPEMKSDPASVVVRSMANYAQYIKSASE